MHVECVCVCVGWGGEGGGGREEGAIYEIESHNECMHK